MGASASSSANKVARSTASAARTVAPAVVAPVSAPQEPPLSTSLSAAPASLRAARAQALATGVPTAPAVSRVPLALTRTNDFAPAGFSRVVRLPTSGSAPRVSSTGDDDEATRTDASAAAAVAAASTFLDEGAAAVVRASRAGGDEFVSVQRVRASAPAVSADTAAVLHEKSAATVAAVESFEGSIELARADTSAFDAWAAWQDDPALGDTPSALAISSTARAGLAVLSLGTDIFPPPLGTITDAPKDAAAAGADAASSLAILSPANALAVLDELRGGSGGGQLVTAGSRLDALLLADRDAAKRGSVREWGQRPAEASPFDQLMLRPADSASALDRTQIFELFARARADPGYWTSARLAERFNTKQDWVEALLELTAPPIIVNVDGKTYGVYGVRRINDAPMR